MGRSIALTLAREGADLILTYRRGGEEAEQVAAAVRSQGQRALSLLGGRAFSSAGVHPRALGARPHVTRGRHRRGGRRGALARGRSGLRRDRHRGRRGWGALDAAAVHRDQPGIIGAKCRRPNQDAAFLCLRAALPGMRQRHWGRIVLIGGHAAEQWTMTPPRGADGLSPGQGGAALAGAAPGRNGTGARHHGQRHRPGLDPAHRLRGGRRAGAGRRSRMARAAPAGAAGHRRDDRVPVLRSGALRLRQRDQRHAGALPR